MAYPKWADLVAIKSVYAEAKRLEASTGIKYCVDHIVPLENKLVCGLHVAANLRAIPFVENAKKKNKFIQELAWPLSVQPTLLD